MKSTFRTLFYVKKNQPKANGKVAIMARITINTKVAQLGTKLEINLENWDAKAGKAIGRTNEVAEINRALHNLSSKITKAYNRRMDENGYAFPDEIKNDVLGFEASTKTLISYFTEHNNQYKMKVGKHTTHKTYTRYELAKSRLIDYMKEKYGIEDISIRELNVAFIENFYLYLMDKCNLHSNTAMKCVQRFRRVINFIKATGETINDPFINFRIRFQETDREVLTQDEIDRIRKKNFRTPKLNTIRDIFIFSVYTGLAYVDVSSLMETSVQKAFDGNLWIMIKRTKTNVNSNIRLLDIPKQILEKYKGKQKDGKLLPVISNQKINEYLKDIGELCDIDKPLSFHIARHSFATTIALSNGVPIETVSKMLGHRSIRTTQIYAKITDLKISKDMDDLARRIDGV